MNTVEVTKIDRKAFSTFSFLRKNAADANIDTLKQISSYIAKTTCDNFDVNLDCTCEKMCFGDDGCYYIFSLSDGKKIIFSADSSKFNFWVFRYNEVTKMSMFVSVYEQVTGDLSTTSVYAELGVEGAGKYVVTFRPKDLSDDSLKYATINYYSGDEIDWVYTVVEHDELKKDFDLVAKKNGIYPFAEKSYFDLFYDDEISLDNLSGYVSNTLSRIDLLLSNMEVLRLNALSLSRKKK